MEHTANWSVEIYLFQHESSTTARAVLHAGGPREVAGNGSARSVSADQRMPEVVDEVAAGRALLDLGARLTAVAVADTEALLSDKVTPARRSP